MTDLLCQPCLNQDKREKACVWCLNCDESLCKKCHDYHKALKITRDHLIIQDHEYRIISTFLSSVKTQCERHPENNILFLCTTHNDLCCKLCKETEHSSCLDVDKIEDIMSRDMLYAELKPFKETTDERIKLLSSICENRNDNIRKLQLQYDQFLDNLKEKKQIAVSALDQLESEIKAKFECGYLFEKQRLETEREDSTELQSKLTTKLEQLDTVINKQPLSTVQLVLTKRHLLDQCENDKRMVTEYVDKMADVLCECKISVEIGNSNRSIQITEKMNFTSIKSSFNSKSRSQLDMNDYKENTYDLTDSSTLEDEGMLPRCEPLMTPAVQFQRSDAGDNSHGNNSIKLVSFSNDTQERNMYSCHKKNLIMPNVSRFKMRCVSYLPNDRIMFGGRSNPRLMIYDESGDKHGEIKLQFGPNSITVIDACRVAVNVGKATVIANFINFEIEKHFGHDDDCFGIAFFFLNNSLIVNCENKGLLIINLDGTVIKTINHVVGVLHLAPLLPDTIVCVNRKAKLVNFLNIASNDQHCFEYPGSVNATDITSDASGNVYISCNSHSKIYMLSRDSNNLQEIIISKDDIDRPLGIDCSPQGLLYITNNDGKSIDTFEKNIK